MDKQIHLSIWRIDLCAKFIMKLVPYVRNPLCFLIILNNFAQLYYKEEKPELRNAFISKFGKESSSVFYAC